MNLLNGRTIDYVYHIADIHLRNLKRHTEYRLVFYKFLKVLDNKVDNSILYIGGDIAHAKTEMSPELVREVSWFLKQCADRIPTLVIAGNHDCNLLNPSRLDVLSPIIESLNHPNLFYLRDTGVYEVGNLTISVFSIFDNKDNWIKGTDITGDHKIVFFHGPVYQATTDVGYSVNSKSFPIDLFDGFHIGMFGDIHRRQILQQYNERLGLPILAYSSSLIQQNHGELLENHGYLLWNIKKRKFTAHNIYNEYGYITIDVMDGKLPQWIYDEINTVLPKNARIRLKIQNTNAIQLQSCITELNSMFDDVELSITRMDTLNSLKMSPSINSSLIGNVRDAVFQNKLISDYLNQSYSVDKTIIDKVCDLNIQSNNKLNSNETHLDRIVWIPKLFEFSNMFSYGDNNKINFDNATGLIGLFAANGQGKSAIWDALSFCIFDKCSRAFKAQHIMNNQKNEFYCKFHFQIDKDNYYIERLAKKTKVGVRVDVNFWREFEGNIESLNGEHRRDTNDKIEHYIGKYDDFILTTLSLQGNNSLFIDKSQSERKDTLSQFIGIDVFDKLYLMVSDEYKQIKSSLEKYSMTDYNKKISDLKTKIKEKESEYEEIEVKIKELIESKDDLDSKYINLIKGIVQTESSITNIEELIQSIQLKEDEYDVLTSTKVELNINLDSLLKTKNELNSIYDSYIQTNVEDRYVKLTELTNQQLVLNLETEKLNDNILNKNEILDHLNEHEYNPECSICVKNSKSIIDKKEEILNEIQAINESININLQTINNLDTEIIKLDGVKTEWLDYLDTQTKIKDIDTQILSVKEDILNNTIKLESLSNSISDLKSEVNLYYKNENAINQNFAIESELKELEPLIQLHKNEIETKQSSLLIYKGEIERLKYESETTSNIMLEFDELFNSSKIYEMYLDTINRDGVPYMLISRAIPAIEQEINNILTQIVDFTIELEMDGKTINAYIVYSNQKWPLEMSSGMERFIGGLAIRIALINLCNLPRPNFLIVDEGLGTLDNENLQSIFLMFSYLKMQFDFIILISHLDIARDFVDSIMEIRKKDEFSYINF
jgi:DNA repair exonuclease SbcCD ATPase subunit